MKTERDPWKLEAWELRDWFAYEAEKRYGRLSTRDYLVEINKIVSQMKKRKMAIFAK